MSELAGRVALVTGSSRGIGRAIALRLAREGADVALHGRTNSDRLRATADEARALGARVAVVAADLASADGASRLATEATRQLGPIDILVNNAAIAVRKPFESVTVDDWNQHVAINLTAAFVLTQAVLPTMRERRWGRVLFLSSTAVQNGGTVGPHYAATKGGLLGLMRGYATRVAPDGVTMNAISPGLIDTDMLADAAAIANARLPVGRTGTPDEVADVALLLVTNSYMTGQVVNVNGGWYMGG